MLSSQTRVTSSSQRQSELRQTYLRILPSMQCNCLDSLMFPSACLSEGCSYWSFSPRLRQSGDVTMVTTSETPSPAPNFLVLVKHVFYRSSYFIRLLTNAYPSLLCVADV
jgi:hypothetical protein